MKRIILFLTVITTINLTATPFSQMEPTLQVAKIDIAQKYFYAQRAAKQGNPRAMFDLGMMYAKGQGVRQDLKMAFKLFHKSARRGNVDAKFYMGLSFEQGKGVRKQTQLARYWFKLAAKAGHRTAMVHLAVIEQQLRPHYGQNRRVAFNNIKVNY